MAFEEMDESKRQARDRAASNWDTLISAGCADPLGLDLSALQRLLLIVTVSAMLWLALIGAATSYG